MSTENFYKEAREKEHFVDACNTSEILVRTAYQRTVESILDMAGLEPMAIDNLYGLNEFIREYSSMLEEINKTKD